MCIFGEATGPCYQLQVARQRVSQLGPWARREVAAFWGTGCARWLLSWAGCHLCASLSPVFLGARHTVNAW